MTYEERSRKALNPAARELFELMVEKETNLAFADDVTDVENFLKLADKFGPYIAVLKTHIDILDDFSPLVTKELITLSEKHGFEIFEDRKFVDIGNTVRMQYGGGIYKIADWANLVNATVLAGPGVIDGLYNVMKEKKDDRKRGILILTQMTTKGTLTVGEYTEKSIEIADMNKEVVAGHIGAGSNPFILINELSPKIYAGHIILSPGVNLEAKKDRLGQRYATPRETFQAGTDCIIVGRGILDSDDPLKKVIEYKNAGWEAYLERIE